MGTKIGEIDYFLHQLNASLFLLDWQSKDTKQKVDLQKQALSKAEIQHMKNMIGNFMKYRKIPTHFKKSECTFINLDTFLSGLVRKFDCCDRGKKFNYTSSSQVEHYNFFTNQFYLEELCRIFLENACQHGLSGKPVLVSFSTDVKKKKAFIHFKNKAKPLSKHTCAQVWDPFFTTQNKTTGLGLGIAQKISKSLRLELSCDSSKNEITFSIIIPLPLLQ